MADPERILETWQVVRKRDQLHRILAEIERLQKKPRKKKRQALIDKLWPEYNAGVYALHELVLIAIARGRVKDRVGVATAALGWDL
ncbi:MAG TPA: hypothetical protein VND98_00095 [Solirubrobacterales bacterium]|nr:hypothetical protein [Solirubrobacterales bacterium]